MNVERGVVVAGIPLPGEQQLAALVNLNGPGRYLHWGVLQVSVANLVVIGLMVLVAVAAVVLPFPGGRVRR